MRAVRNQVEDVIDSLPRQTPLMRTLAAILLIALAYVLTGKLAVMLAMPPGYATGVFPPAGIAIAALMLGGVRWLPGVLLGAFALNCIQGYSPATGMPLPAIIAAAVVALGSALQAWCGASAFKRWLRPALDAQRDVLGFLLLTPLICLISASIAIPTFYLLHIMPAETLLANWFTWWVGDTIGVLLAAPMLWVFTGKPRRLWWRRRWMLLIPLCLSSAAFIGVYMKVSVWENQQQLQSFQLKSQQVGDTLQYQFNEHERVMRTLAALFQESHVLSAADFSAMARSYLDSRPEFWSIAWTPRVLAAQRSSFESWVSASVAEPFQIRQFSMDQVLAAAAPQAQHYPITFIEPQSVNQKAHGLDLLSEPQRAAMVAQALQSSQPSASAPLTQVRNQSDQQIVLLAQTVNAAFPGSQDNAPGLLVAALRVQTYIQHALNGIDLSGMNLRLEDISAPAAAVPLLDQIGRAYQTGDYRKTLVFGGRSYQLTLAPTEAYLAQHRGWQSWSALVGGLLLSALLGAFLLLISGQRMQIEGVVIERTRNLYEREARLRAILDNAADAILTVDRSGQLISVNSAGELLFGYAFADHPGLSLATLVQLESGVSAVAWLERMSHQPGCEISGRTADGRVFPLSIAVSLLEVSDQTFFVCILQDLTERQRSQEQIYQLAHHDPLTGLSNRATLTRRLEYLQMVARRSHAGIALLWIDLDHFKKINDTHGQQVGDQLLTEAAARLKELLREADTVARLGSDQFSVVLTNYVDTDDVAAVAQRVIATLTQPYQLAEQTLRTGASIGISLFPSDGNDADSLLRHADAAMHAAKAQGRGTYQFFSSELNAAAHERLLMENRIEQALQRQQFTLYLQPQIHLSTRKIIGAEVLIRWQHPELGMIPPDRFIPIAEECGLILPIGDWVLAQAMHILAEWQRGEFPELRLAVNLSARQCISGTLIASVDRLQQETGADLCALEMEITETAAMQDPEQTRELLQQLRARGIKVAIDDFGTGYSSLSYLKLFAIDRIKIDRGFVMDIENDQNDALIASATIALAHTLGLEVIAEGVETEAQCAFLTHELCDEGQGYLFGRPVPRSDFEALVQSERERASGHPQLA